MLRALTAAAALAALVLIGAIAWKIVAGAWPAIDEFGLGFLVSRDWNPVTGEFGALQFVVGTIVTSFGAVLLAGPISIAIGLFLSELAPPAVRTPIGTLIEMLAAIPSVVIGLWGIFVFGPWVATHLEPALNDVLGWMPLFSGSPSQSGMLPAILVLTIMIIPITSSLCRELFVGVPRDLEEGAVALGATRWEMVRGVVLPYARGGVVAAVILGLGRALGEAIAVTQVIGGSDRDAQVALRAGRHAREPPREPVSGRCERHPGRLALLPRAHPARDHARDEPRRAADRPPVRAPANGRRLMVDLRARGHSRRRLLVNRVAEAGAMLAALLAVGLLAIVVGSVLMKGLGALNWSFFTEGPVLFGQTGGGIAPAIVGTLILIGLATAMAVPVGVLIAIYVAEFAPPRVAGVVRLWLDVLNGFPSIVIGIFVFALLVVGHGQSGYAGAFALAIIMLPLVSRSTMEVLALVPTELREASYALGVSRWRTIVSVVVPTAFGGILTGTTLAVARAAGETAPLLFTTSIVGAAVSTDPHEALASIPVTIFTYSESPDPALHEQAWAAAFVLIAFVLVTSLTARILFDRSRRKLGHVA